MKRNVKVFVDASVKDGKTGIGIVIMTNKDMLIYKRHWKLHECDSPLMAEMTAIKKGIEVSLSQRHRQNRIHIYSDCKAAIKRSKIIYPDMKIEWIPRKLNFADLLSRKSVKYKKFEEWKRQLINAHKQEIFTYFS